ncbi:RNA-binding protein [Quillaja saponaria]|uniref:RNA-binding protein n=1 Tax=Quillaja saponaria TaxID=32244 RepID=A0AAD7M2L9_QUISA|nr:RNA-binding protein [Quillaja saponaria]KAJ7967892.1 RNA-binding protein [Quillaja saponaria]
MGCISSKFVSRSISFHEERRQSLQRTTNPIPSLEDIIITGNGSDHYLALVCTANTVANKLHSQSFSSSTHKKPAIESVDTETINKLLARLDQGENKEAETDLAKRSKSCHWFPDNVVSSLSLESSPSDELKQDKAEWSCMGMVRSRSFHTVEEYDALVNKIWFSKSSNMQQKGFNDEDDDSETSVKLFDSKSLEQFVVKELHQSCLKDKYTAEENHVIKDTGILCSEPERKERIPRPNSHGSSSSSSSGKQEVIPSQESNVSESAAQGGNAIQKGNKRKIISERLESLRIPSHIQFPAIASLRERLPVGGIYSYGTYITPKFGSYSLPTCGTSNECSEDVVFSPELVAAFEQCMQQLQAEEENILKKIVENSEEGSTKEIESRELTPPCTIE